MATSILPKFIALIVLLTAAGALLLFAARPAAAQTSASYDTNGNSLIEIRNLEQLIALYVDLDGDGNPSSSTPYDAPFPAATPPRPR